MAEQTTQLRPASGQWQGAAPSRSKWIRLVVITAFVACAIIIQLTVAVAILSTMERPARWNTENLSHPILEAIDEEFVSSVDDLESAVEVGLGEYTVTTYQAASATSLRVDCRVYATVAEKHESEFLSLFARNQNRVREQVIITLRDAELPDLTDPGLGLIKRRILTKVNQTFGQPLLRTVVISEFALMEQ
jgi:flagellar FliL protein